VSSGAQVLNGTDQSFHDVFFADGLQADYTNWRTTLQQHSRAIAVKQMPEIMTLVQGRLFFVELESCMNIDRPFIVFDCSRVIHMDEASIHVLLCCLEEAMKRNGDVKLAAVTPGAMAQFQHTGVDCLFEIFPTNDLALNSFNHLSMDPP
jgi:anti-sigma B factor antagonist